jgi:hypothetical protein
VRRDALHSLFIPLLLRAPWMVAFALLVRGDENEASARTRLIAAIALLGQSVTWWAVDAMLRYRARSVFNTAPGTVPAPAMECYARGLRRLPWLYLTEFVRNVALTFAYSFFLLPGIFLSYRLAFSTEAVVLDEPHLAAAFRHSFHLSQGRFERWLEMIAASVTLALSVLFVTAALFLTLGAAGTWWIWLLAGSLVAAFIWPIIQYAWTFFYLRLVEVEIPEQRARRAAADAIRAERLGRGRGAAMPAPAAAAVPLPEPAPTPPSEIPVTATSA